MKSVIHACYKSTNTRRIPGLCIFWKLLSLVFGFAIDSQTKFISWKKYEKPSAFDSNGFCRFALPEKESYRKVGREIGKYDLPCSIFFGCSIFHVQSFESSRKKYTIKWSNQRKRIFKATFRERETKTMAHDPVYVITSNKKITELRASESHCLNQDMSPKSIMLSFPSWTINVHF